MNDIELFDHTDTVNELLARYGVKFGIYKNNTFKEQLFPFDSIPRIIEKAEFNKLEKGLKQRVMDNIHAFWGVIDDDVEDEKCRNTILIGKRVERIDLYGRLRLEKAAMFREVQRLVGRIDRSSLIYRQDVLQKLQKLVEPEDLDYYRIVQEVEQILA